MRNKAYYPSFASVVESFKAATDDDVRVSNKAFRKYIEIPSKEVHISSSGAVKSTFDEGFSRMYAEAILRCR